MTVAKLIEALSALPKHMKVIIQKDAEGNDYSPLYAVDGNAIYIPQNTWSGEVHSVNNSPDYEPDDWSEIEKHPHACACCVLAPIN